MRNGAWTLVELLVIVAVIALLAAVLVPTLGSATRIARLAACASAMRDAHVAIIAYAAENRRYLPPFAFSDFTEDLPLSGHWGGASQPNDPAAFGRKGVSYVNLWALVMEGRLAPARLVCPGAEKPLREGKASYFASTFRFSTYGVRMPYSRDLFAASPGLADRGGSLLGIYLAAAGGQSVPVGQSRQRVPQVRLDRVYRADAAVAVGDGQYDPAADVMFADMFWRQGFSQPGGATAGGQTYPVQWAPCHDNWFNACYGDGAVKAIRDDGTIRTNSIPPGGTLPADGVGNAVYAERVWQFLDRSR